LRSSVDDITSERDLLLREKRSVEARLEEAKAGLEELVKGESPSLRDAATLDKEVLDLKSNLAQQEDVAAAAVEKMRRAEALVSDVQKEIAAEREASTELQKQKAALEKNLNEAQLKLIDLETKGFSTASQDIKFLHKRIQEVSRFKSALNSWHSVLT
jgi:myosin protein heavy chain